MRVAQEVNDLRRADRVYGDHASGTPDAIEHSPESATTPSNTRQNETVTASTMFAESIGYGTPIRGTHVQELRKAIDALRSLAGLAPYTAGWTDYNPPTGFVLAIHQTDMRTALDQAVFALLAYHLTFTGTMPANGVGIATTHLNQLRSAVK